MTCLALLMGCGRSSGSGTLSAGSIEDPKVPTDGLTPDPGPVDGIPVSGNAKFEEQMTLGLERVGAAPGARTSLTGDLTVDVDIGGAAAQVTGNARDFSAGGASLIGTIYLERGNIDRAAVETDPTFVGNLSGPLKDGGDSYVLTGGFSGDFRGTDQSAVDGVIYGSSLNGSNQTLFDGRFQTGR